MKKESTLRSMLGFSQKEMAEMLNVSRSLYSMFELGKRDLPVASKHLLSNILAHFKDADINDKNGEANKIARRVQEEVVTELLSANITKRWKLELRIATALKRQHNAVKKIQALNYLESANKDSSDFDKIVRDHQLWKAKINDEENSVRLFEYNIQMKLLNVEHDFLKGKIYK